MSDAIPNDPDSVVVRAQVQVLEVKPKHGSQSVEVRLSTSYTLDKLKGLTEAMMNCAGGNANLTLEFIPEQSDLFDEDDEDEGQQELA